MGEKDDLNIFRFIRPITSAQKKLMVLYQVLTVFACFLYWLTLEGGSVEFLKDQAGVFAVYLVLNIAILLGVGIAVSYTMHTRLKLLNWSLQLGLVLFTVTRDLGADLENHGQFNLMVYFLMWLPLIFATVAFHVLKCLQRVLQNQRLYYLTRASGA